MNQSKCVRVKRNFSDVRMCLHTWKRLDDSDWAFVTEQLCVAGELRPCKLPLTSCFVLSSKLLENLLRYMTHIKVGPECFCSMTPGDQILLYRPLMQKGFHQSAYPSPTPRGYKNPTD